MLFRSEFINSRMIHIKNPDASPHMINMSLVGLTYDNDAQNPSKMIDRITDTVVSNVPFWNPAIGQYDQIYMAPVDVMVEMDPAIYSNQLPTPSATNVSPWMGEKDGYIWVDTSTQGFLPYYDKKIMPALSDRIFNWGRQADWADIETYQWTRTTLSPDEWESQSELHVNDMAIDDDRRITGLPRKVLYVNVAYDPNVDAPPVWEELKTRHVDLMAGLMEPHNAPDMFGDIEVYINGKYAFTRNITTEMDYMDIQSGVTTGTYLHFILRAPAPSDKEKTSLLYKYDTPHTLETTVDPISGKIVNVYHYWVSGKSNKIVHQQREYTLQAITNGLKNCTNPYMILEGLRPPGAGYGLIYGNIFDEFGFDLPHRYTQLIVKGLEGRVDADERYTLRFTKNYNLRDELNDTSLRRKNVHTEWKLFRELQYNKIDRYLWDRITEAICGYRMTSTRTFDVNITLPSLNRIVYDNAYGSDTRIGLGPEQVFLDASVARRTVRQIVDVAVLELPEGSIKTALIDLDMSSPESTISTMDTLYLVADSTLLNRIFFECLHESFAFKKEYAEIFKTSWVTLQISQNVTVGVPNLNAPIHNLVEGEPCIDDPHPTPPIQPPDQSPWPSPTPTPTPVPTPTPTPIPVILCGDGENDRHDENSSGRTTETEECRNVE